MTGAHGGTSNEGEGYTTLSADYVFRDTGTKSAAGAATLDDGIQDTTAENLFRELKAEAEPGDPTDEFEGVSPESIVDDADGHEHEQFTDGGQTLTAGSDVETLLIPDRSEGDEFRWVDPGPTDDDDGRNGSDGADEALDADAADLFEAPADEGSGAGSVSGGTEASASTDGPDDGADVESDDDSMAKSDAGNSGGVFARLLSFLGIW